MNQTNQRADGVRRPLLQEYPQLVALFHGRLIRGEQIIQAYHEIFQYAWVMDVMKGRADVA